MVGQYPHRLYYKPGAATEPAPDEDTGDWDIPAGDDTLKEVKCRAEMNGNNRTLALQDGSKLEYAFVVYLPKGTAQISKDVIVEILAEDGTVICKASVKQFHQGQLNRKLYV